MVVVVVMEEETGDHEESPPPPPPLLLLPLLCIAVRLGPQKVAVVLAVEDQYLPSTGSLLAATMQVIAVVLATAPPP